MNAITIIIRESSDNEGYMYDVYRGDLSEGMTVLTDSDDGGLCTTTMENALEMAADQAKTIIRSEKGEECPGCWEDMQATFPRMNYTLGLQVCPKCHKRAEDEGDFISER